MKLDMDKKKFGNTALHFVIHSTRSCMDPQWVRTHFISSRTGTYNKCLGMFPMALCSSHMTHWMHIYVLVLGTNVCLPLLLPATPLPPLNLAQGSPHCFITS